MQGRIWISEIVIPATSTHMPCPVSSSRTFGNVCRACGMIENRADPTVPAPLLTNALLPQFEAAARGRPAPEQLAETEAATSATTKSAIPEMVLLLSQLPAANWFLLADIGD